MKFTTQEIRGAILKTAALFEAKPELWSYGNIRVPECGSRGCAVGYIGHFLGIPAGTDISIAAEHMGYPHKVLEGMGHVQISEHALYDHLVAAFGEDWFSNAENASAALRAYADTHFPAEQVEESKQLVRWSDCIWQPKAVA